MKKVIIETSNDALIDVIAEKFKVAYTPDMLISIEGEKEEIYDYIDDTMPCAIWDYMLFGEDDPYVAKIKPRESEAKALNNK